MTEDQASNITSAETQTATPANKREEPLVVFLAYCAVISVMVFIFDLFMPLGVAGGVPYVCLVLLGLRARSPNVTFGLAIFGTFLTIVGYYLSAPASTPWIVLTNRGLAIFVIWTTAVVVYQRAMSELALMHANEELEERVFKRTMELQDKESGGTNMRSGV